MKSNFILWFFITTGLVMRAQIRVNYDQIIAGKPPLAFTKSDTVLQVFNVHTGEGKNVKLEINASQKSGAIKSVDETESVTFNLKDLFKKRAEQKGFLRAGQASVPYTYDASKTTSQGGDSAKIKTPLSYTGIGYWDAITIFEYAKTGNEDSVREIINAYAKNDYGSLEACEKANDFIRIAYEQYNPSTKQKQNEIEGAKLKAILNGEMTLESAGALGALSGIDVTKYVQAFADFLSDHIKAELTIAFIEKFREKLQNTPEFAYLLPKTIQVLNTGNVFDFQSFGATCKTAFAEDLEQLAENFERMVYSLETYKKFRDTDPLLLSMSTYYAIKMSGEKYHPADILEFIDGKYGYNGSHAVATRRVVSLLNLLSKNLKSTSSNEWINKKDISVVHPFIVHLFFGLVYEQNKALFDQKIPGASHGKTLKELLQSKASEKILQFVTIASNIESRIASFNDKESQTEGAAGQADVLEYFLSNADDLFHLMEFGLSVISAGEPSSGYYKAKGLVQNSIAVAKGIKSNNVGQVSVNTLALIQQVTGKTSTDATIQQLTHYVNFITDMVNADSAPQIKQVLQNYAAPVRSYRVIRGSSRAISLSAFPGIYVGRESVDRDNTNGSGIFGVTAPIGFAIGWGGAKKTSFSLFLPLVDIGAALTYRWNTKTDDLPQQVLLGQIFSPGLFGVWGIKNSPLAIKFGTQYLPKLRMIKDGANQIEANTWHTSLSLAVDIPVFIFSQKY